MPAVVSLEGVIANSRHVLKMLVSAVFLKSLIRHFDHKKIATFCDYRKDTEAQLGN